MTAAAQQAASVEEAGLTHNNGLQTSVWAPQNCSNLPVVPEFSAYKATRLVDIVCKRNVRLYSDRVQSIHPQLGNEKTWFLDRTCKLEPEYADEVQPEKRTVRSPGQWTVTAKLTTVTGQAQEPIELVGAGG